MRYDLFERPLIRKRRVTRMISSRKDEREKKNKQIVLWLKKSFFEHS